MKLGNSTTALALIFAISLIGCSSSTKKNDAVMQPQSSAVKKTDDSKSLVPKTDSNVTTNSGERVVCRNEKDERAVNLISATSDSARSSGDDICQISYRKFGSSDIVARAKHQKEFCTQILNRIKSNLENGGFNCTNER